MQLDVQHYAGMIVVVAILLLFLLGFAFRGNVHF